MLTAILLCALTGILIYRLYKFMFYRPPNFPPGPPRLPFFDSYVVMLLVNYNHMHKAADALCKYYKTNILGLYLASTPTIIVNDEETVKKALLVREFDGKPKLKLAELRDPDFVIRGVFFTEGPFWKEQRRYMLRYLREFGFGRRFQELESETGDEFKMFIDIVTNGPKYDHEKEFFKDNCVLAPLAFSPYLVNIFMKTVLNERVPRKDMHIFNEIIDCAMEFQRKGDAYGRLFSHIPNVAKLFPNWSDFNRLRKGSMKMHQFMKGLIDQQVATYDSNFERSFVHMYFTEMKKAEAVNDKDTTHTYEQLVLIMLDFFLPALTAVAAQVSHLLHVLCLQPEIQTKIHNEIDEVVGQNCLPVLDDRINLPYTEACIREIMRYVTLAPSGIPHQSLADTEFMGYDIPKGTLIITSLYASHKDPSAWQQPDVFMPERLLDDHGKLCLKKDRSLPFGAGKRLCAGETFARNTMFLFVSALLQNFTVKAPKWEKLPSIEETLTGIIVTPRNFWLEFVPRK